ncbi:MAG: type II toxin-antitoxin system PemK/MazF family toxin [Pseudomonadota bacterium]|nr:type II toxin-antitoxin system PemK/MazF family toxin [Pseudomonadota bacterium]
MAIPSSPSRLPAPGDVLPYGFLWSHQSEAGREDPVKERPCVVVLAVSEGRNPQVIVAPITSRDPRRQDAIALTAGALGLDRPSWIVPWELNAFRWPGPDVGRAARPAGAWWRIGALAPNLRRRLRDAVEKALNDRRATIARRSE